jgi:sporulation protein YlmC with PRC-barrel domain
MSESRQLDLALRVLDQQLIDWGGRKCGKVDDILIEGEPGKAARVTGLLVGPAATMARRPGLFRFLGRFTPQFGDPSEVEVPWSAVDGITHVVKLKEEADDLGLHEGEKRALRLVGRIPGS